MVRLAGIADDNAQKEFQSVREALGRTPPRDSEGARFNYQSIGTSGRRIEDEIKDGWGTEIHPGVESRCSNMEDSARSFLLSIRPSVLLFRKNKSVVLEQYLPPVLSNKSMCNASLIQLGSLSPKGEAMMGRMWHGSSDNGGILSSGSTL